jgi:hypothetical protein
MGKGTRCGGRGEHHIMLPPHAILAALVYVLLLALALYPGTRALFGSHGQQLVQVLIGLGVVAALYFVSLLVMHKDQLVVSKRYQVNTLVDTLIIDGFSEVPVMADRSHNTVNPRARSYVHMPRSYNRVGGAQFTYSFWIYLGDTTPGNVGGKTILMRGDTREYKWKKTVAPDPEECIGADPAKTTFHDGVAIKCPRIAFGPTYDSLQVQFNTFDDLDATVSIDSQRSSASATAAWTKDGHDEEGAYDPTLRHNVLKLIENKWVLMTFVFEDHMPINDFEDGIQFRFFLNDILYSAKTFRSALRQNSDDLHLFPDGGIKGARFGDLRFMNYAVDPDWVREKFRKGPPKSAATEHAGRNSMGEPLYLNEYNKLDIYNS